MASLAAPASVEATTPISFLCTLNDVRLLKPKISSDVICAQLKQGIEAALSVQLKTISTLTTPNLAGARSLKIELSIRKPGIIIAKVTQQNRRTTKIHPEISIAVFDRAIDARDFDQMAREIAQIITQ